MEECSCGRWYESMEGVNLCHANKHGSGIDNFNDKPLFTSTLETEIKVSCAECAEPIRARVRVNTGSLIEIDVLPHVCQVGGPE